jgi:hypothetical protein
MPECAPPSQHQEVPGDSERDLKSSLFQIQKACSKTTLSVRYACFCGSFKEMPKKVTAAKLNWSEVEPLKSIGNTKDLSEKKLD